MYTKGAVLTRQDARRASLKPPSKEKFHGYCNNLSRISQSLFCPARWSLGYLGQARGRPGVFQQHLKSTRRNTLPVKLIDGSLVMCHKHLACALVEQMEIGKPASGPDRVLHHPPEAFDGVQVVATM